MAKAEKVGDTALKFTLQNELDSLNAIEIDLLNREVDPQDPLWETECPKILSKHLNFNTGASLNELEVVGSQSYGKKCFDHFKSTFGLVRPI